MIDTSWMLEKRVSSTIKKNEQHKSALKLFHKKVIRGRNFNFYKRNENIRRYLKINSEKNFMKFFEGILNRCKNTRIASDIVLYIIKKTDVKVFNSTRICKCIVDKLLWTATKRQTIYNTPKDDLLDIIYEIRLIKKRPYIITDDEWYKEIEDMTKTYMKNRNGW